MTILLGLLGAWGKGQFICIRASLFQGGLDKQYVSWQEVVSAHSLHPCQRQGFFSASCH